MALVFKRKINEGNLIEISLKKVREYMGKAGNEGLKDDAPEKRKKGLYNAIKRNVKGSTAMRGFTTEDKK